MLKPCPSRRFYLGELFVTTALLLFVFILQWYNKLPSCPLCEMQRLIFAFLWVFFLWGSIFKLKRAGQLGLNFIIAIIALSGVAVAARQVWLQYFPPLTGGGCEADLYYLFQIMPWLNAIEAVFMGGPACAKVTWHFLYLSIPQWSLLWFTLFFLLALWQIVGFCSQKRER